MKIDNYIEDDDSNVPMQLKATSTVNSRKSNHLKKNSQESEFQQELIRNDLQRENEFQNNIGPFQSSRNPRYEMPQNAGKSLHQIATDQNRQQEFKSAQITQRSNRIQQSDSMNQINRHQSLKNLKNKQETSESRSILQNTLKQQNMGQYQNPFPDQNQFLQQAYDRRLSEGKVLNKQGISNATTIHQTLPTYRDQKHQELQSQKLHQIDLFENLEKELKGIIDEFNKERALKKKDIESLKRQLRDYEAKLINERELFDIERQNLKLQLKENSKAGNLNFDKHKLKSKYKQYKDLCKNKDLEIRGLNDIVNDQQNKLRELELDNQSLQEALFNERQVQKQIEDQQMRKLRKDMGKQMKQLIQKDREIDQYKQELDVLRRDLQTSYRSMGERVVKQSFHFNSSNNNINPNLNTSSQAPGNTSITAGQSNHEMKLKRQYEQKFKEMQEKIQQLEIALVETERRAKKEYDFEVGRLRQMLYAQNNKSQLLNQSSSNNISQQTLQEDKLMPLDQINDRVEKMNQNLSNLEKKFNSQVQLNMLLENTSSNQKSEDFIYDGISSADINQKGTTFSQDQIDEKLYSESLETVFDLNQKRASQLNITSQDGQSTSGPHHILTYRSQGTISAAGTTTMRQHTRQLNSTFYQQNLMNEELVVARKQLEQLRDEIYYIQQKQDLSQKSMKKQIIQEIRQQLKVNSKRFELLEHLVYESNKCMNDLKGQILQERDIQLRSNISGSAKTGKFDDHDHSSDQ
eukprot:403357645